MAFLINCQYLLLFIAIKFSFISGIVAMVIVMDDAFNGPIPLMMTITPISRLIYDSGISLAEKKNVSVPTQFM